MYSHSITPGTSRCFDMTTKVPKDRINKYSLQFICRNILLIRYRTIQPFFHEVVECQDGVWASQHLKAEACLNLILFQRRLYLIRNTLGHKRKSLWSQPTCQQFRLWASFARFFTVLNLQIIILEGNVSSNLTRLIPGFPKFEGSATMY